VAELALDDVERHAFACEFDGVGVAQLVRSEAASSASRITATISSTLGGSAG
jgi:hypothetical protein